MKERLGRLSIGLAAALAASLAVAAAAAAIPWDQPGAIPPSQTPSADSPDPFCRQSYADDAPAGGPRLEFGIGPRLAGEAGTGQTTPLVPEDPAKRDAALLRLKGRRTMSVRLNRLFQADGQAGIRKFKRMARHYARLGFDVELQVRYHPAPAQNGDIGAWLDYVRRVVRAFGPIRHVVALQITNEVNLTFSPNTSDGAYANAVQALARGVPAAKREARRLGYRRLRTGFNYAWRFGDADADFWRAVGAAGGKRLRRATDWVGIDTYPGTFVPATFQNAGDALLEGIAQLRECYMPLAGFGRRMPIHLEELGYPTGPGRSEATQKTALQAFVRTAHRYRGTYNLTSLNWFGLRDNNSAGPDFQSFFGLLRDDYSQKPAFGAYRRLVRRLGA
ncbi:MAG: hypothetical protein ACXWZM_04605 [Solirubrobacterales bacterium]